MSEKEEIDVERWLSRLLSELIRRGIDSDEHIHLWGEPMGEPAAPSPDQIRAAHTGFIGEFLTPLLEKHLDMIARDYERLEKRGG